MKIRFRGQSVRLRLGQSEVVALARGEAVQETTDLGPAARFGVVLRPQPGGEVITHTFVDGLLGFRVPADRLTAWAGSDAVGIEDQLPLGNDRTLRLLIEKDFACTVPDGEPDADAFPNPSTAC